MKTCVGCGESLPETDFKIDRQGANGPIYRSRCKPCGNARRAALSVRPGVPDYLRAQKANWSRDNPARVLLMSARRRAKQTGRAFSITLADIEPLPTVCPVLGIPLLVGMGRHHPSCFSIDRRNNRLGYIPGNVVVTSLRANTLKGDATARELAQLAAFYNAKQPPAARQGAVSRRAPGDRRRNVLTPGTRARPQQPESLSA
jgi:hypothetical protein